MAILYAQCTRAGTIGGEIEDWSQWQVVTSLPTPGYGLAAAVLSNSLYAIGGYNTLNGLVQTNVYKYDGTNWISVAGLPSPRYALAAATLNGSIYAFGGLQAPGGAARTNVYKFNGTTWTEVSPLPSSRSFISAGVLNGALYALGGANNTNVYRFDGSSWTAIAALPNSVFGRAASELNGVLYAVAGGSSLYYTNVFGFNGTAWAETMGLPTARYQPAATTLNGYLYAIGGKKMGGDAQTNVYRFNGTTWTEVAGLPAARYGLAAGTLSNRLYALGGGEGSVNARSGVFRYPNVTSYHGVAPSSGSITGGYSVVISGTGLGNGSDITNVTLCGTSVASILNQSVTQVVVTARAGSAGTGSVAVYSPSQGTTIKSNAFTYIAPLNQTPTNIMPSSTNVAEILPVGTKVGHFTTQDPDAGNTFTYTLVAGTGDGDNGSFSISGSNLLTAAIFNYEVKSNYSIRVQSADQGGLFTQKVFAINVSNVNETPTNILLSSTNIAENLPAGTKVGHFTTQDPDFNSTFTYTLVAGTGSGDNGSFSISGSNLLSAAIFNYEIKSNYSLRVQSTDQGSLSTQKVFAINVTNIDEPPPSFSEAPTMSGSNMVIRWGSITNKKYTIHFSTNLFSGFSTLQSNIPGTPAINSYTDSLTTVTQKYWKVTTDP